MNTVTEKRHSIRDAAVKLKNKYFPWADAHPYLNLIAVAFVINLVIDMMTKRSPFASIAGIFTNPIAFAANMLIFMLTLSPAFLFKKRAFYMFIIGGVWVGIAIASFGVQFMRITPIAAIDFSLVGSVWTIITVYLEPWSMAAIAIGIVIVGFLAFKIWKRAKKHQLRILHSLLLIVCLLLSSLLTCWGGEAVGALSSEFQDLAQAYRDYGFIYCFSNTVIDRGIERPDDYSELTIEKLMNKLQPDETETHDFTPSIVFLQMESFFDPMYINGIEVSQDPTPVFRKLKETCSTGLLTVPSIGAGTANTEFEIITGMCLDYFGTGEYPYETVLHDMTVESINYNLKELGYKCHALHNHRGDFYDRHIIYSNLGFDTFTSVEYMPNVVKNPLGWAKDSVLTEEILKALDSTDGQDLIYTVSMQAHGKYPRGKLSGASYDITSNVFLDTGLNLPFDYYLNQLYESDAFLGDIIAALEERDEPVMLIIFGDHLPSFEFAEDELNTINQFQTEYVIWTNYESEKSDRDLQAYQLTAHVMDILGFDNGILTKAHQRLEGTEDYFKSLEMLEYDMIYGDQEVYNGETPHKPTELQLGSVPIKIGAVSLSNGYVFIHGNGFTASSAVYINDKKVDTVYINDTTLQIDDPKLESGDSITIRQLTAQGSMMSETAPYIH